MEELVGEFWHRLITGQASTDYEASKIELPELASQLAPFYRALGGSPGKTLEAANPRKFKIRRKLIQKMAGTHKRLNATWQDERSVRLPPSIAYFNDKQKNEDLYFWLVAMAAQQPNVNHWFIDNQKSTLEILNSKPGLKKLYYGLVEAALHLRPQFETLEGPQKERELAIRQALIEPGSVDVLPKASGDVFPICLWLYPQPLQSLSVAADEDDLISEVGEGSIATEDARSVRKEAQRIDNQKKTDGLLIFMLDSMWSWTEHVELDRPEEENADSNVASAAEDLDIITVSRKRRAGSARIKFDMDLPSAHSDELALGDGIKLPEWDYRKAMLVQDFCLLQPFVNDDAMPSAIPEDLKSAARLLKNKFSALKFQPTWLRRQPSGTELDLDACLEHLIDPNKDLDRQDLYKNRVRNNRDVSCLVLADLSMSTDSGINHDQRVIDVIRNSIVLFSEALDSAGDPFAVYGFSSIKNKQVRYHVLKNFAEPYGDMSRGRMLDIKPGFYTRMGAAIRQSAEILNLQKTSTRLLLIISDGKPNDIDHYEGRYGIEDTRKAILEAKAMGLTPYCITIDEKGNDYLPYLFGDKGFSVISDITRLPSLLPKVYLNLTGFS